METRTRYVPYKYFAVLLRRRFSSNMPDSLRAAVHARAVSVEFHRDAAPRHVDPDALAVVAVAMVVAPALHARNEPGGSRSGNDVAACRCRLVGVRRDDGIRPDQLGRREGRRLGACREQITDVDDHQGWLIELSDDRVHFGREAGVA